MVIHDEPGPLQKIDLWQFPVGRGNRHMFETLAAPVSQQLNQHADQIGASTGPVAQVASRDINSDFAHTIHGAIGEIGGQLGSLSDIDPAHMYVASLESLGDLDGSGSGLPAEGTTSGGVSGGGGSQFDVAQWAEVGSGSPAPRPGPVAPPGGSPPSGDGGGQPPPPGDQPPPGDAPPPPAPPPDEPPQAPPWEQPGPEPDTEEEILL